MGLYTYLDDPESYAKTVEIEQLKKRIEELEIKNLQLTGKTGDEKSAEEVSADPSVLRHQFHVLGKHSDVDCGHLENRRC